MYHFAVDAMALDKGCSVVIAACQKFVLEYDVVLHVFGDEAQLRPLANSKNIVIHPTTQIMDMTDGALAVRRKKDASMVRAVESVCNGECAGIVSGGSTGALLSSATLLMKNMEGINRGALMVTLPTRKGPLVLLDVGANAENQSKDLLDFGLMGEIYAKSMYRIEKPRVGLLNIGGEAKKGAPLHREAFALLDQTDLHFVGNVEGRDLLDGDVDVVVCDGFSGNIALKSIEGAAEFMTGLLKEQLMSSLVSKIGALLSKKALKQMKDKVDYRQYGGGLCIGVNYPVVKAHGSSNEVAFFHALRQLYLMVENDVVNEVRRAIHG